MTVLRNSALVLLGIVLGLGLLEGALRLSGWAFLRMRAAPTVATDKNTLRVLCIGESTTADTSFPGRRSYPAQLELALNAARSRHRFVVVNGGVPAITTDVIVSNLPATLDRVRPDIVVTMMGINDGTSIDPVFQVASESHWRIVKLAKWAYVTWCNPSATVATDGSTPPEAVLVSSITAWTEVFAGHMDSARGILAPMLAQDEWPGVKLRALGIQAIIGWLEGKMAEAEASHAAFVELDSTIPKTRTAQSYRTLQAILRARGIPLVAVQYPALPAEPLRAMVEPGTLVVDNEAVFLDELRRGRLASVFRDLLGGLFGHMTPYANGLLAESVARGVLQVAEVDHSRPSQQ